MDLKVCGKCGRKIFEDSASYERRLAAFQKYFETTDDVCDGCMKAINAMAMNEEILEIMRKRGLTI